MKWKHTLFRWLPALAILFGLISRIGSDVTWLIQPSLMFIMFNTFVESKAELWSQLKKTHLFLILGQVIVALGIFVFLNQFSLEIAVAGLIIALTPTAVSAGAIASGLRLNMGHVMSVIVVSNLFACLTFSIIPTLIGDDSYSFASSLEPFRIVGITVIIPFMVSKILLRINGFSIEGKTREYGTVFIRFLWAAILGVSASRVGDWYFENFQLGWFDLTWPIMLGMGTFALFAIMGYYFSSDRRMEALVTFSHKNTGLALLLIINTFPISAVAVILSYSLTQNVFFSLLIGRNATRNQAE